MWRWLTIAVALATVVTGCGEGDDSPRASGRFDAERAFRDLREQVAFGPRPAGSAANRRQAVFLADQLQAAGVSGVRVQRPLANVVGTVSGTEDDALLLAAHHDTKDIPGFVGANDGTSGVAVALELARVLPDRVDGPSVHFALFDGEEARGDRPFAEDGLRGSRQYVAYARRSRPGSHVQGTPPLAEIQSMILFDLVGDCDLQIPREASSDPDLYEYIALHAGDDSPFGGTAEAVADDHVPFLEAGVTAVNLIDFTYGPGPRPGAWWHTTEDTLDKVCAESLDAVGEAVASVLPLGASATSGQRSAAGQEAESPDH